ncbi:MAG: hypothetical protein AB1347_11490 [Acidobacteriota bacterium]
MNRRRMAPPPAGEKAAPPRRKVPAPRVPPLPGQGSYVVAYLRDPREKVWGLLLRMEAAGFWIRGIELNAFEDWAREVRSAVSPSMGLSTTFLPFLRVEKIVADERTGSMSSLAERFEALAGRPVGEFAGLK